MKLLQDRTNDAKATVKRIIEKLREVEDKTDEEKDAVWAEIEEPFTEVIKTWREVNREPEKISNKTLDSQT